MTGNGQGENGIKYCMIHYFPVICAFVHVSVDSPALLPTTPDRRPPRGQPILNMHWTGALSSFLTEEDAPRRRGIVRKSNMNPKNIGSYKEGEEGRKKEEGALADRKAAEKEKPHASRRKNGFNEKLMRFCRFGR